MCHLPQREALHSLYNVMVVMVCSICYMCIIFLLIDWKNVIFCFLERKINLVFPQFSADLKSLLFFLYIIITDPEYLFIHSSFFAFTHSFIYPRNFSESLLNNLKGNMDCEGINTCPHLPSQGSWH